MIQRLLAAAAAAALSLTAFAFTPADGEVRKVDKAAGKITLKHGPIKNLDMPPMTMVFGVKDKALLDAVKAGDKVRFTADKDGEKLILTSIEAKK